MLVTGAGEDAIFEIREIEASASAYGTQAAIFPGMTHDMMLESGSESVAQRILAWLAEVGL